ncbi:MAG TPA: hypothetical protein VH637_00860 [Streptosporangiaceae bacterium]|jgi:hypothetical protein
MPGDDLPEYPNYRATFGTSLAVVTSLMASLSTAIVVVLAVDTTAQAGLGFLRFTPDQVGTTAGTAAIVLFVAASMGAVYAQAANSDESPARVIYRMLLNRSADDKAKLKERWEGHTDRAYKVTRACWVYGLSAMLVTLGTLVYGKVPAALPVLAVIAMIATGLNLLDSEFRTAILVVASVLVAGGSGLVAGAAAWAIWS